MVTVMPAGGMRMSDAALVSAADYFRRFNLILSPRVEMTASPASSPAIARPGSRLLKEPTT